MIIAIVDDGIFKDEIATPIEKYYIGNTAKSTRYSHATICAKIIERYGNVDKFIDIQFINNNGESNIELMCLALEKCLEINVDIINLSNGIDCFYDSMPYYKRLSSICAKLNNKGIIICAAQSNSLKKTIPAAFDSTISVEQIDFKNNVLCTPYRISDIYTEGEHSVIISNKIFRTEKCNSYACAYAASQISSGRFHCKKTSKSFWFTIVNNLILKSFVWCNHCRYPRLEIPIIYIDPTDTNDMYHIIKQLKILFARHGYFSEEIVSYYRLKHMGLNYITRNCLFDFAKILCFNTKADILIIATQNYRTHYTSEDVLIKRIKKGYRIKIGNKVLFFNNLSIIVRNIINHYAYNYF